MIDHTQAVQQWIGVAQRAAVRNQESAVASRAATTYAMLAIADAIRGLTPNAVQDAAGCPQNDAQPEPGQSGRGRGC